MLHLITLLLAAQLKAAAIDCGACGAHVAEWHYVQGWDGSPVAVCAECNEYGRD